MRRFAFIEKCGFAAMHIFPIPSASGTKAAAMAQVDMSVREARRAAAAVAGADAPKAISPAAWERPSPCSLSRTEERARRRPRAELYARHGGDERVT